MDEKQTLKFPLPPMNLFFNAGWVENGTVQRGAVCRVSYVNEGQGRFTAEVVAVVARIENNKPVFQLTNGDEMTLDELEAYRRIRWPQPHETATNPANVTLGVQSGVMGGKRK